MTELSEQCTSLSSRALLFEQETTIQHVPVSRVQYPVSLLFQKKRIRIQSLSMKVVANDYCHSAQPSELWFSFWNKILRCEMKGKSEMQPPPNCQTIIMNHIEGVHTTHDFYIFCSGKSKENSCAF